MQEGKRPIALGFYFLSDIQLLFCWLRWWFTSLRPLSHESVQRLPKKIAASLARRYQRFFFLELRW